MGRRQLVSALLAINVSTGDQFEIVGRLALAALLGGIIGLERELRGYPAGIRTLALVTRAPPSSRTSRS